MRNRRTVVKTRKKRIKASMLTLVIIGLAVLLVFTGFKKGLLNPAKPKNTLIDIETRKVSAYSFELLRMDDIKKESVKGWVNRIAASANPSDSPVYYTLYNNTGEGMDMYLFMPDAKELIGDISRSNITISEAGTSLAVHIDTDEKTMYNRESKDLILHVYVSGNPEEANAKTEELIINGKTYSGVSTTFMTLE